jgi:hypothetical protein
MLGLMAEEGNKRDPGYEPALGRLWNYVIEVVLLVIGVAFALALLFEELRSGDPFAFAVLITIMLGIFPALLFVYLKLYGSEELKMALRTLLGPVFGWVGLGRSNATESAPALQPGGSLNMRSAATYIAEFDLWGTLIKYSAIWAAIAGLIVVILQVRWLGWAADLALGIVGSLMGGISLLTTRSGAGRQLAAIARPGIGLLIVGPAFLGAGVAGIPSPPDHAPHLAAQPGASVSSPGIATTPPLSSPVTPQSPTVITTADPLARITLPAGYVGTWRGTLAWSDGSASAVILQLKRGKVGDGIGTVSYPGAFQMCSDTLLLNQISSESVQVEVQPCGGMATLQVTSDGLLQWSSSEIGMPRSGTLVRDT